jgi:hypothetical protein
MSKIPRELAEAEVAKWLDHKRVSEKKRESYTDHIEQLIDGFMEGDLILKDDFILVQNLKNPIKGEDSEIKTLEFKPRIKIGAVHNHLTGVKSSDGDGRVCAYVSALTSRPKDLIRSLYTDDYGLCQAIAVFFL